MATYIEFYDSGSYAAASGDPGLGRFMDDMISKLEEGGEAERRIWDLFDYLCGLGRKTPDELKRHLASCRIWRPVDGRPVYRSNGEPFVLFTAYADDETIRVVALGVADVMSPEEEARCERLIEARCRVSIVWEDGP